MSILDWGVTVVAIPSALVYLSSIAKFMWTIHIITSLVSSLAVLKNFHKSAKEWFLLKHSPTHKLSHFALMILEECLIFWSSKSFNYLLSFSQTSIKSNPREGDDSSRCQPSNKFYRTSYWPKVAFVFNFYMFVPRRLMSWKNWGWKPYDTHILIFSISHCLVLCWCMLQISSLIC